MINFENTRIGQYVYSDLHNANVRVLSLKDEGGFNGKRVGVAGYNAPHWNFLPARADAETILHTRAPDGKGYYESGIMGKQGEPWAITNENF